MQGFVRIAVRTGSALVPVLSFGENNIFQVSKPKEKSTMALVQKYEPLLRFTVIFVPHSCCPAVSCWPVPVLPFESHQGRGSNLPSVA